ncbi:MAG: orotate phosphoribosyltransferase [Endozoicomonadaceae bacterium]|nr:orotate phosphoribosyltransferase [Endozoicomonadaceae bacterium]
MYDYQENFLHFCVENNILCFGEFELKSGRKSPYFFNAGLFNTGKKLNFLGETYQQTLQNSGIQFDLIFGPAYKGIPLACAVAGAYCRKTGEDIPWCFNRKEVKSHGEGGQFVGKSLQGKRVALVDDVITAGTAIGEVVPMIKAAGGEVKVICTALNRQERAANSSISSVKQVEMQWNSPVISIITLNDIFTFIQNSKTLQKYAQAIDAYQRQYCEEKGGTSD